MLREDVVEAVEDGKFRVFAVRTIDEAMAVLTGLEAGQRDENGEFPPGSVNGKVEQRLIELATLRKQFSVDKENSDDD